MNSAPSSRPAQPGYVSYARMDELLELQNPQTDEPAEMGFIIISQVKELLFRLLAFDVEHATARLRADEVAQACRTLERVLATVHTLHATWEPLAGLRPDEFARIRTVLEVEGASGLQSVSYRRWEFAMGRRDPAMLKVFRPYPHLLDTLTEALRQPSLYDEALALLARRGHELPPSVIDRDPRTPYQPHPAVARAWALVYRDSSEGDPLRRLAEALVSVAYAVGQWRYTHLLTVERIIGPKAGTGGTDGASWLSAIAEHRFFPELWQARYEL